MVLIVLLIGFGWEVCMVGDMGVLLDSLLMFLFLDVLLIWDMLCLLLLVLVMLVVVGLLELMMIV